MKIKLFIFLILTFGYLGCKRTEIQNNTNNSNYLEKAEFVKNLCGSDSILIAQITNIPLQKLNNINPEGEILTDNEIQRINEVYRDAVINQYSLIELRNKYDSLEWYNWVYYLPVLHPWWFWGITIILILLFILNRTDEFTDIIVESPYTYKSFGSTLADIFFFLKNGIIIEIII